MLGIPVERRSDLPCATELRVLLGKPEGLAMEDRTDLRLDDEGRCEDHGDAPLVCTHRPPKARIGFPRDAHHGEHQVAQAGGNSDQLVDGSRQLAAPGIAAAALLFVAAGLMWSRQNDENCDTQLRCRNRVSRVRRSSRAGAGRNGAA